MQKPTLPLRVWVIPALLFAILFYGQTFSIPLMLGARQTGLVGSFDKGAFLIKDVWEGSPAALAGCRVGDRIFQWNGKKVGDLHELFRLNTAEYMAGMNNQTAVDLGLERRGESLRLRLIPRKAARGWGWLGFGFRMCFGLLLAGLACFIMYSNPRDGQGFVVALGLCFALMSLLSGMRYSHLFLGPFLGWMDAHQYVLVSVCSILATMAMLAALVWFLVSFPNGRRGGSLLGPLVYGLPILLLGCLFVFIPGTVTEKISGIYTARMWLSASYLTLAIALALRLWLTHPSAIVRERIRVIGLTVALVSLFVLFAWVLPRWFFGFTLINNIDYMFLPAALIPAAILFSIQEHHLFGIPGIVRRRLRILEKQLQQETALTQKKDERIHALSDQIKALRAELNEQSSFELAGVGRSEGARYLKLEQAHPYLKTLRNEKLVGVHACWDDLCEQLVMAAKMKRSVLIRGESGTGKTDCARAIHLMSERRDLPFREVSCAQFEHGDPAFALGRFFGIGKDHGLANIPKEGRKGLLQECDGGTLFLDDVDRLPLHVQDLLLYPLEGKPFDAGIGLGGPYLVDVKFVFASNRDLENMGHQFRGDILARMGTRVEIPPLRARKEDIPVLVTYFQPKISEELGFPLTSISPGAMQTLCAHDYRQGNTRELKRYLEAAIARAMLAEDPVLRAGYLAEAGASIVKRPVGQGAGVVVAETAAIDTTADATADADIPEVLRVLREHHFRIKESETALGMSHKSRTLSNHLRGICLQALCEASWDVAAAARAVVGSNHGEDNAKIAKKMGRFLQRIRLNLAEDKRARLYNNLPAKYHEALEQTIAWSRKNQRG